MEKQNNLVQEDQVNLNQIKNRLIEIQNEAEESGDFESSHEEADNIICELLAKLGYEDIVAEWLKVPKWYS
jgi:hypothetical protein